MGTDYLFRMGSTHRVCQDYALAGVKDGIEFAIVSDGCSGSADPTQLGAPNTDFGARFLTRATLDSIPQIAAGIFPWMSILQKAYAMTTMAGLGVDALDATLIVAVRTEDGVRVYQTGDGTVGARRRTGEVEWSTRQFANNAPFYLNYHIRGSAHLYKNHVPSLTDIEGKLILGGPAEAISKVYVVDDFSLVKYHFFSAEEYDLVLLTTDGAESFVDTTNHAGVNLSDVMSQVFAFKGLLGEFLRRRYNGFQKHCQEKAWKHEDDFSLAGIVL